MRPTRFLHGSLGLAFLAVTPATAAHSKDLGILPGGIVVSCEAAVTYRDGALFRELDALIKDYDAGREQRINATMALLNAQRSEIVDAWEQASSAKKRLVASNAVGVVLSFGSVGTGKWLAKRPGLSAQDKLVAELLVDRGATLSSALVSADLTKEIDTADIALLPVSTIVAVAAVPSWPITVVGIGRGLIGLGSSIADYYLQESEYKTTAAAFSAGMDRLAKASVDGQIGRLNATKNAIDTACN